MNVVYELGRVRQTRYDGDSCEIEANVPESLKKRFAEYVVR